METSLPWGVVILDSLVGLSTSVIFFIIGWLVFSKKLFITYSQSPNETTKHLVVQLLFSLTFMLSIDMFELIVFEIFNMLSQRSRWINWKIDMCAMLFLLVFVIPIYSTFLIVSKKYTGWNNRLLATFFSWLGFLLLLYKVGDPFPTVTEKMHGLLSIEHLVSRIGVIGVTSIGILTGYGAVSCSYKYLGYCCSKTMLCWRGKKKASIEETDPHQLRRRLVKTIERILVRTERLSFAQLTLDNMDDGKRQVGFFQRLLARTQIFRLLTRMKNGDSSEASALHNEITTLSEEIRMLEAVRRELEFKIADIAHRKSDRALNRTWKGVLMNILGQLFSLFWVYKFVVATINITFHRVRKIDPVSQLLQLFLMYIWDAKINLLVWEQHISLIFIAIVVTTQVRGFLESIVKLFRMWSTVLSKSSCVILLLAELMGMYFVSSVLLMRMNLPFEYRRMISRVLGDIEFHFYHHWFDMIFVCSAICSMLIVFATSRSRTLANFHSTLNSISSTFSSTPKTSYLDLTALTAKTSSPGSLSDPCPSPPPSNTSHNPFMEEFIDHSPSASHHDLPLSAYMASNNVQTGLHYTTVVHHNHHPSLSSGYDMHESEPHKRQPSLTAIRTQSPLTTSSDDTSLDIHEPYHHHHHHHHHHQQQQQQQQQQRYHPRSHPSVSPSSSSPHHYSAHLHHLEGMDGYPGNYHGHFNGGQCTQEMVEDYAVSNPKLTRDSDDVDPQMYQQPDSSLYMTKSIAAEQHHQLPIKACPL